MLNPSRIISSLALLLIAAIVAVNAQAQSAQVYISARNGDDGGSCAVAQPCRTLKYALTQVQPGGIATIIDSGDYDPSIVIAKSVTIAAAPGVSAVFSRGAQLGTVFLITGPDSGSCSPTSCNSVILRGLTFDGQNITQYGIRSGGVKLTVEDCSFSRFQTGIFMFGSGTLRIKRSAFRGGLRGVNISPTVSPKSVKAVVGDSHFEDQEYSGINAVAITGNTVELAVYGSHIDRSGFSGVFGSTGSSGGGSVQVDLEECKITNSSVGVFSDTPNTIMRVSNSTIVGNLKGLDTGIFGGVLLTRGNNTVEANRNNGAFTGTFAAK